MIRISCAIMAHPSRADFIPSIVDTLDDVAQVVWDERNDRWDTGRRSMLAYDRKATHHLVIQDDAILCADLVAGLTVALNHVPADAPVGLYVGSLRPRYMQVDVAWQRARRSGSPWLVMEGPWWGVGVVVPTDQIRAMVSWGDLHPEIANYDRRMARFFKERDIDCWYTVPSLIDHRSGHPSLIPGRTGHRTARTFIGKGVSALSVEWAAQLARRM